MSIIIVRGASGVKYKLWAYPIGSGFAATQGVYAFCRLGPDGVWYIQYVGQAGDLNARVGEGVREHHKIGASIALGATHVAAGAVQGNDDDLCRVEQDIIQGLNPPLNQKAAPGFGLRNSLLGNR